MERGTACRAPKTVPYFLKVIVTKRAVVSSDTETTLLETGVESRTGKGHCARAFLLTLYRHELILVLA